MTPSTSTAAPTTDPLTGRPAAEHVRPLLLLEMNEIPWRLLDRALGDPRWPHLTAFFAAAQTYTTVTPDRGELSPWVTWPSFHRGIPNTEHGIANLGQDVATFRGVPLWQEYRRRGLNVGVCGSMQSWPPLDPGAGGFYIPDTFAHDERCIPAYLEPLQRFNLGLVRKNGLVVRDLGLASAAALRLVPALVRARLRPRTLALAAAQIALERVDRARAARRPIFQTLLFWDIFRGLYRPRTPPALATFFTNHVAGVMHRYWDHVFPEDFPGRAGRDRRHVATMDFALSVCDDIVADALDFARARPDLLVAFATSMGQAAVHRDTEGVAASVTDLGRLLATFGAPAGSYKPLLAMVPQVAAEVPDAALRASLARAFGRATTKSGRRLFLAQDIGQSLSITILTPRRPDIDAGGFYQADEAGRQSHVAWADAGVTMNDFSGGTGYHVPEGVLALVGRGLAPRDDRARMPSTDAKGLLMRLAGLEALVAAAAFYARAPSEFPSARRVARRASTHLRPHDTSACELGPELGPKSVRLRVAFCLTTGGRRARPWVTLQACRVTPPCRIVRPGAPACSALRWRCRCCSPAASARRNRRPPLPPPPPPPPCPPKKRSPAPAPSRAPTSRTRCRARLSSTCATTSTRGRCSRSPGR